MAGFRPLLLLLPLLLVSGGCRSLSRDLNSSLPEFLRSDPGEEEMEILTQVRRSREWSPEDLERQRTLLEQVDGLIEAEQHEEAAEAVEEYLEEYPGSAGDERARFLLAESWRLADDYAEAFDAYESFANLYPVSTRGPAVMEATYAMGREYLSGERSRFLGIFSNKDTGREVLRWLVETYPASRRAADAQWAIAQYHLDEEEWEEARAAFDFLTEQYPTSPWYPAGLYLRSWARWRQVKGEVYDPRTMREARREFQRYLTEFPDGEEAVEARRLAAELEELEARHLLRVGEWYVGQGKPFSARFYFLSVINRFPESGAAEEARAQLPAPPEARRDQGLEEVVPEVPDAGETPAEGEVPAETPAEGAGS